jgi:hypothetical protein
VYKSSEFRFVSRTEKVAAARELNGLRWAYLRSVEEELQPPHVSSTMPLPPAAIAPPSVIPPPQSTMSTLAPATWPQSSAIPLPPPLAAVLAAPTLALTEVVAPASEQLQNLQVGDS